MDTLSCDLLDLIDKHLDALTSVVLGMSTGYHKYLTGYEDFHRDKNVKWLLYAVCQRGVESQRKTDESAVISSSATLLAATVKYIRKTRKYGWLDFIENYLPTDYWQSRFVNLEINKARLYRDIDVFKIGEIDLIVTRATIVYCIKRMFKIGWLEGIIKMSDILATYHGYTQSAHISILTQWSYEFGFMDVIDYYKITPNVVDKMFGMLKSTLDYNEEIDNLKDEFIDKISEIDDDGYMDKYYDSCILELICSTNKSQWLIDHVCYGDVDALIYRFNFQQSNIQTIVSYFRKAIKKSNIHIANIIMNIYIELHKKSMEYSHDDEDHYYDQIRSILTTADYSKILDDMVMISVVHNVPSLYKKKIGSCECCSPFQTYCQTYCGNSVEKLKQKMVEAGDYSAYSQLPRSFWEIQIDLKSRHHQ